MLQNVLIHSKGPDDILRVRMMISKSVRFEHVRRNVFTWRGLFSCYNKCKLQKQSAFVIRVVRRQRSSPERADLIRKQSLNIKY